MPSNADPGIGQPPSYTDRVSRWCHVASAEVGCHSRCARQGGAGIPPGLLSPGGFQGGTPVFWEARAAAPEVRGPRNSRDRRQVALMERQLGGGEHAY